MKTHKNPALRTGPAPFKPPTAPKPGAAPTKPVAAAVKPKQHPPLVELQGKKWAVVSMGWDYISHLDIKCHRSLYDDIKVALQQDLQSYGINKMLYFFF